MQQIKLFISIRSPFARRIRLALNRFEIPHEEIVLDVFKRNETLMKVNPLGLVPAMVTPEGVAITDSAHILETIHDWTNKVWPAQPEQKVRVRQASVWCQGVMQYIVSYFLETSHHAVPSMEWAQEYIDNIKSTLALLDTLPEDTWEIDGQLTQAAWDRAVAFQYLELRLPELAEQERKKKWISLIDRCLDDVIFLDTIPK